MSRNLLLFLLLNSFLTLACRQTPSAPEITVKGPSWVSRDEQYVP